MNLRRDFWILIAVLVLVGVAILTVNHFDASDDVMWYVTHPFFVMSLFTIGLLYGLQIFIRGISISSAGGEIVGSTADEIEASRARNLEDREREMEADWMTGIGGLLLGGIIVGMGCYIWLRGSHNDSIANVSGVHWDGNTNIVTFVQPPIDGMNWFIETATTRASHNGGGVMVGSSYQLTGTEITSDVNVFIRYPSGRTSGSIKILPSPIGVPAPGTSANPNPNVPAPGTSANPNPGLPAPAGNTININPSLPST